MKVKRLIEILQTMPQEASVRINLRQSENMIDINRLNKYKVTALGKDIDEVEIVADWQDFKLDEEENYFCEEELVEAARPEPEY